MKWIIVDTSNYGSKEVNWYYQGEGDITFMDKPVPKYTKDIKNAKIFENKKSATVVGAYGKIKPLKECLK